MQIARRPTGQFAHRLGRAAGRSARWLRRRERQAIGWLVAEGLPAPVAAALLWIVKLVVVAGLLYVAFWLALLLGFAVAAAWVAGHSTEQDEDDFLGRKAEERDHRKSIFYHPASYNDDPDPRFEDD
ncbi:DUF3742 domain-containing protein [Pollutimonas nitritireducens]|uniref:DUF3742 domain-containing protein n=2 Tax=Pollutimonas nitritireducens TaxID=2045209 RepID=A0A2N4UD42_9BURK|nr:DUF3742 domain-containing protein [Pollutimonas nitritireducens]